MTVTLPDSLRPWVESQAAMGGHASVDEYLEAILVEQRNRMRREIDRLLLEAAECDEWVEVNDAFWEERQRVLDEAIETQSKGTP